MPAHRGGEDHRQAGLKKIGGRADLGIRESVFEGRIPHAIFRPLVNRASACAFAKIAKI